MTALARSRRMAPLRLAAVDLHRHLVFQPDRWDGRQSATVTGVLDLVQPAIPALCRVSVLVPAV